jgi:hypothetical protein
LDLDTIRPGRPVVVVEYDPRWAAEFAALAEALAPYLTGLPVRLEHVGSTSVPGLAAEPVIDVGTPPQWRRRVLRGQDGLHPGADRQGRSEILARRQGRCYTGKRAKMKG